MANKALAHREELKEQGRWKPFLEGQDLRHIPVKVKSSPRGRGRGKSSPQQDHQVMDNQEPMEDSSEEQETSIMVGRGMLADLRQLMQKVSNATQQTAVAIQSQNPIPNPYVRELQDKQAQYLELLNKPNKTALDQFYIKRLGLRIKELIERVQTEQAAPKSVTLKEPTLREGVGEALEDAAQNNTLNLVQQRRPERRQVDHHPTRKRTAAGRVGGAGEEETPKGTGKQQRKKGRKLKYTQAPPQFQFSYRPRRGTPIAHPTRNRQRSRTGTGVSGGGILRLPWLE